MVAKTPGLSLPLESNTQFSHEPLPIGAVLPEVLARYGALPEGQQSCQVAVTLSQVELDTRYFEQQRQRSYLDW